MYERTRTGSAAGQASVELIAVLPILAVVLACAWQIVLAGHAVWSAGEAARVAAREYAVQRYTVGSPDARVRARVAADRVLPKSMRRGRRLDFTSTGTVSLRSRVPLVAPFSAVFDHGPTIKTQIGFRR